MKRSKKHLSYLIAKVTDGVPLTAKEAKKYNKHLPEIEEALNQPFSMEMLLEQMQIAENIDVHYARFKEKQAASKVKHQRSIPGRVRLFFEKVSDAIKKRRNRS